MFQSMLFTELAMPKQSIALAEAGQKLFSLSKDPASYARFSHARGVALVHAGHAGLGIPVLAEAAELLRHHGNDVDRAHCFSNLYLFAQDSQYRHVAEEAHIEATQWTSAAQDWRCIGACTYGDMLGSLRTGRYEVAEGYAHKILDFSVKNECAPFRAYALEGLAEIAIARGDWPDASRALRGAIANRRMQGFRASVIERRRLRSLAETIRPNLQDDLAAVI